MPSIWKDVCSLLKNQPLQRGLQKQQKYKVTQHQPTRRTTHQDKDNIDKVNINSININSITFNRKCSVITANLNTSSSQATSVAPYVDSGSDGNSMPFHIFKKIYPSSTKEQTSCNEK